MLGQSKNGDGKRVNGRNGHSTTNGTHPPIERTERLPDLREDIGAVLCADARHLPLPSNTVDLVVTSPPYWRKRDYGIQGQIGQETSVKAYVDNIIEALREWRRVLRPTGSVFLNIGDTYDDRNLAGVPARVEIAARDDGWLVRNRIIWAKENGMPDPAQNRLASRYEFIFHLTSTHDYY